MTNDDQPVSVSVSFGFIEVAINLWKNTTDFQIPVHESFVSHLMGNRASLLIGFEKTARAWLMMLNQMKPAAGHEQELQRIKLLVEEFKHWATNGLAEINALKDE